MRPFTITTIELDGDSFDAIHEYGDDIYWIPGEGNTFQTKYQNGRKQRIAGTSYGAFGADMNRTRECEKIG